MPELPEVETIRRDLQRLLRGRSIEGVEISDERILTGFAPNGRPRRRVDAARFAERLAGRTVGDVLRRGKYIIFALDDGAALICHLRMTGQAIVGPARPDARARIRFAGSEPLSFCDVRRFGEIWIAGDWSKDPSILALGPEPLNGGWDPAAWGKDLRASRAKVQSALLDQRRLAGLGNIYVTEALFHSGIRPTRRCHTLRASDVAELAKNVKRVLEQGIRHRGVSFYSYRDASGKKGEAQAHLSVYGRAGEACPACGETLKATKVSGRGTVYCPKCQK